MVITSRRESGLKRRNIMLNIRTATASADPFGFAATDDTFDAPRVPDNAPIDPGPLTGMFDSAIAARQYITGGKPGKSTRSYG